LAEWFGKKVVAMTGSELRALREELGLSASSMGIALGYSGPRSNISVTVRRLERGTRRIPPSVEKLAWMIAYYGIPPEWEAELQEEASGRDGSHKNRRGCL
jgi:transcriptional regulator with XRE-family HTH domain